MKEGDCFSAARRSIQPPGPSLRLLAKNTAIGISSINLFMKPISEESFPHIFSGRVIHRLRLIYILFLEIDLVTILPYLPKASPTIWLSVCDVYIEAAFSNVDLSDIEKSDGLPRVSLG